MPRLPVLTVLALSARGAGVSLEKGPAEGRLLGTHRYSSSLHCPPGLTPGSHPSPVSHVHLVEGLLGQ